MHGVMQQNLMALICCYAMFLDAAGLERNASTGSRIIWRRSIRTWWVCLSKYSGACGLTFLFRCRFGDPRGWFLASIAVSCLCSQSKSRYLFILNDVPRNNASYWL